MLCENGALVWTRARFSHILEVTGKHVICFWRCTCLLLLIIVLSFEPNWNAFGADRFHLLDPFGAWCALWAIWLVVWLAPSIQDVRNCIHVFFICIKLKKNNSNKRVWKCQAGTCDTTAAHKTTRSRPRPFFLSWPAASTRILCPHRSTSIQSTTFLIVPRMRCFRENKIQYAGGLDGNGRKGSTMASNNLG